MTDASFFAFRRAVETVGGPAAAGQICGCSRQNIHQLLERQSPCPASYVRLLSDAAGIRRSELRPDLYPAEDEPTRPPPGWGKRAEVGLSPAELEMRGQVALPGLERNDDAKEGQ